MKTKRNVMMLVALFLGMCIYATAQQPEPIATETPQATEEVAAPAIKAEETPAPAAEATDASATAAEPTEAPQPAAPTTNGDDKQETKEADAK
jgi:hypothetical protein